MGAPRIELHPRTPWILQLFDRIPLSAFWVGVLIAAALFAVFLAYSALFGAGLGTLRGLSGAHNWGAEILQDLFFGFTLAIAAASVRGALRDFDALRPTLDLVHADPEALRHEILTYEPQWLWPIAVACALFSGFSTPLDPGMWADGRFPGWTHPSVLWLGGRNFLNWSAVPFAMGLELMLGRRFARLGDHLTDVDLLDPAALAPFGRRGLRNVSLWMLLAAFLSLHYAGRGWAGSLLPLALLLLGAFAIAAFLLPLAGARRAIRARKRAELARVRAALRATRERVLAAAATADVPAGLLADLVAYEGRIEGVREWPIDASVVARLALYVSLGLGSWVGGALVDQLLDRALR